MSESTGMRPTKFVLVDVELPMTIGRYTFACPIRLKHHLKKGMHVLVNTRYGTSTGKFTNFNNSEHSKHIKYQWVIDVLPDLETLKTYWGDIDFANRKFTNK